ncbi:hypothetical protein B0T10DRAFT_545268 [Thelonectria olida]|uniref:Uncharacterized protein n=1 Tax=Thelonectria olida TaxID=1576542 RepID=A0A9P8WBR6_9HYPO|nr:hypothetical protein B0T10DRAFT_545268 [Thelonectria olida]
MKLRSHNPPQQDQPATRDGQITNGPGIWKGYPLYKGKKSGNGLYNYAKNMWRHWGHKLDEQQRLSWLEAVPYLGDKEPDCTWQNHHFSQAGSDMTWVHWTFLKIMFSKRLMLGTRAAIWAQKNYPAADICQWEPNSGGPTISKNFLSSEFFHELPDQIAKEIKEKALKNGMNPQRAAPEPQVKSEAQHAISITSESDSSSESSSDDEVLSIIRVPRLSVRKRHSTPPNRSPERLKRNTALPAMLAKILENMDQPGSESSSSSTDQEAGSDEVIAKLEFILSDLRTRQAKETRSEVDDLKRELSKANTRIAALEAARESQDKERQALCTALTQAMGSG